MLEGAQELPDVHSSQLIVFVKRLKAPGCQMKKLEANNIDLEFEFHHPTLSAIFKRRTYQSLSRPSQPHFPFTQITGIPTLIFDQETRNKGAHDVICCISIFTLFSKCLKLQIPVSRFQYTP